MICRHADTCGGCSRPGQPYDEQLRSKARNLVSLLQSGTPSGSVPATAPLFLPVPGQTTDPAHFRQKVAFVFTEGAGGRLELGHYARGARNAVPVDMCPVHSVRGNTVAFALRDRLRAAGLRASGPGGVLRHLIVRVSADEREAVAMLVVSENVKALRGPVRALMDSTDAPEGFFININDRPGPYMVGAETIRVAGASHIREDVGGIGYLVSPTAFFQTNVAAAAVLQRHVVDTMAGAARVLDLYCGSGLFSLPLARAGVRVTGIEENRQAIADAGRNARLNSVDEGQARFLALRVEDAVDRMARERWDGVILDPPRQGCSDEVLEAVFQRLAPPRVTYVSCGPDSLAVELPGILQCGYRIESLRAVDMFPHTDHVEAVLTLTRAADARTSRAASSPRR